MYSSTIAFLNFEIASRGATIAKYTSPRNPRKNGFIPLIDFDHDAFTSALCLLNQSAYTYARQYVCIMYLSDSDSVNIGEMEYVYVLV